MQPIHWQIRLRDGKIEIKTAGGELATASGLTVAKDDDNWHEIAQMDAVSAGMSKFVIGGTGANWATMTPAPTAAPKRNVSASAAFAAIKALPRRVTYGVGGAVSLLALIAVLGTSGGDAMPRDGAQTTAEAVASLRQSIAAMPFARQVTVVERADGTLSIDGFVEDSVERRAIQNEVDASALPATLRVYVRENLRAEIEGTIESLSIPASFTLDDAGNVTLTGTVLDPAAADRLVESVETGVFGLASLRNEIRTADQILSELRDLADRAGLANLVIFRLDGLLVEATGIVPRDKMDNWVGLIGVYSSRFANDIPLRSFVTLDQPAATGTAPIIIGSGPVAEAETGRVVAPDTLDEPNEVDAQSLFAGEPVADGSADAAPRISPNLQAAMDRLRDLRPELYTQIAADVEAGRTPDTALLQEALTAIGGSLRNTGAVENGTPVVDVMVEDIGSLGSLDQIAEQMRRALQPAPAQPAAADESAARLPLAPPAVGNAEVTARAAEILSAPAGVTSTAPAPQEPALATLVEDKISPDAPTVAGQPPVIAPARIEAEVAPTEIIPAPDQAGEAAPETVQTAAGVLPLFALPQSKSPGLGQMMAAADALMDRDEQENAVASGAVSPNLRALVAMQHDQLEMGKTLLQLPKPISALPFPVETATACWEGSKLTPEMVPTALLLLDVLSVNADLDLATVEPQLRDIIMETALSPDRVKVCLRCTETAFGEMVGRSSTFLSETSRNPDFVEFLFRNVPKAELPLAGANLAGDRYIELSDGRKLGEGAAPDITSRLISIGDLGVLLRTGEGTRVQLFGNDLGWRVADHCSSDDCGMN